VRTGGAPASQLNAIRLAIATVSASLATGTHIVTMMDGPMALQRLMAELPALLAFGLALVGLLLSSVGVYGLIANIVARRTREIGVHLAIGARPLDVVWLVTMKTLRPVVWGVMIGGAGAVALSLFLHSLIVTPDIPDLTFGGGAFNPAVFGGVLLVLISVVAAACLVPARRAARLDPTVALRAD
jgi:ABC-type antimicrobial peptide transport system permease subunit